MSLFDSSKIEHSSIQKHVFKQGQLVGELAHQLFDDSILIENELSFFDKISKTKTCLDQDKTIFEGSFLWDKCFCMVDILTPYKDGWELIEVKSSTSVKPIHHHDLSFQYIVLSNLGLKITKISVYTINTSYIRSGEIDVYSLFNQTDITEQVLELTEQTKKNIYEFKQIDSNMTPEIPIGPHCSSPFNCSAKGHCWADINEANSIFNLVDLSVSKKFNHYYKNNINLQDIQLTDNFSKKQKLQIACIQESMDFINVAKLNQYLKKLTFPLVFLDFECYQSPVPQYDDVSPYSQIPFMFSLHILNETGDLAYSNFIYKPSMHPFKSIAEALIQKIPLNGSIVVFNKAYESMIIESCIPFTPELSESLMNIRNRLFDLEVPFKKFWFYMRDFNGKSSIKSILPALLPGLGYEQLELSSGGSINSIFNSYVNQPDDSKIINILIEYSKMDTYAMFLIYSKLTNFL
ncbi:MAG: DUF2779 domain-containing protein [Candidatus Margulisiibacteriota bacterium]|nr:DUF2779 domain-containing protein [Candidatus Margulisiibacteriota bacterium]